MTDEQKDIVIRLMYLIRCGKVNVSMSNKDIIKLLEIDSSSTGGEK